MAFRASCGVLCAVLLVVGCIGGPLPADGPPADFLFRYTYEMIEKPEPDAAADSATAEVKPSDAGQPAPRFPTPSLLRITLVVGGYVTYEAHHSSATSDVKKAEFQIDQDAQDRIYAALREADIYSMDQAYEGPEKWRGRETFEVVSLESAKEVIVEGTVVDALVDLRNKLLDALPTGEIIEPPAADRKIVVMDIRSRVFFRSTDPETRAIPAEFRKEFPDPWTALNSGGRPSPDFGPLPEKWD